LNSARTEMSKPRLREASHPDSPWAMRTVNFEGWPGPVSALGFGCASLGSRISRKDGIAAVEQALAAGVTWFDVAPSYGDGDAEMILGTALAKSKVAIATKVGLVSRPTSSAMGFARAIARPLLSKPSTLRRFVRRLRKSAVQRTLLTGDTIRESLARSLERLKVDSLALLALHEPSLEEVRRTDVIRALNDAKRQGLVARIGVAGSIESFLAAKTAGMATDVLQTANSPFNPHSAQIREIARQGDFTITHSVFGSDGRFDHLREAFDQDTAMRQTLENSGRAVRAADLPRFLLDYAFAANPNGVVLLSSFSPQHLALNVAAASCEPAADLAAIVDRHFRARAEDASHRH